MAQLESAFHLAGEHVCATTDTPVAKGHQPAHGPQGGTRRWRIQLLGCRPGRENRRRVRGQSEEISADQTRHTGSLHAAGAVEVINKLLRCRLLADFGSALMSDLSPERAPKRTSVDRS